jgi:hypothetical protein
MPCVAVSPQEPGRDIACGIVGRLEPSYVGLFQRHELAFIFFQKTVYALTDQVRVFSLEAQNIFQEGFNAFVHRFEFRFTVGGLGLAAASGGAATSGSQPDLRLMPKIRTPGHTRRPI